VTIPALRPLFRHFHQHIAVVAVLPFITVLPAPVGQGHLPAAAGPAQAARVQVLRVAWVRELHWTSRRITRGIILRRGVLQRGSADRGRADRGRAAPPAGDLGQAPGAEQVREAIISPRAFRGRVEVIHDGPVAGPHTASAVAAAQHAALVVNGGFFIVSGADGYPGAPAGLAVYHGRLESMSAGARGALVLGDGPARIEHLNSTASVRAGGSAYAVQGINRRPGVIRNCGRPDSRPFRGPRQDTTCHSGSELVLFTPQLGAAAPGGPGREAVIGPRGTVRWAGPRRGGPVPAGGAIIEGIGRAATWLRRHARTGRHLAVRERLTDRAGQPLPLRPGLSIASGAPVLLSHGRLAIDEAAEGVAFDYAWAKERQPRTIAGISRSGRLLLVTVDGRQPGRSDGATLVEEAALMRALGAVSALNLDGGGSTTMVAGGRLVNRPSDGAERADGDFVVAVSRRAQPRRS
jgi:hypothetical protein